MTSPWGITPYGLGYYGAPPAQGTFYVYGAYPIGSRMLRVELSQEPQHTSPILDYDSLNLRTWKVRRLDTNFDYTILAVRPVEDYRIFDLYLLQNIGMFGVDHAVSPTSMRNLTGAIVTDSPDMPYAIPDMPHWLPFTGTLAPARTAQALPGPGREGQDHPADHVGRGRRPGAGGARRPAGAAAAASRRSSSRTPRRCGDVET